MMTKTKALFAILLLWGFIFSPLTAQNNRTLETSIADALAQVPVQEQEQLDRLMNELINLGEEGILALSERLIPIGQGDDRQARYLLHTLAVYHSVKSATMQQPNLVELALNKSLETIEDTELRIFVINRLAFCGTTHSIKVLSPFLRDDQLYKAVLSSLVSIGTEDAANEILQALSQSEDSFRDRSYMAALGDLKYKPALDVLTEFTKIPDHITVSYALKALAEIADPKAYKTLLKAAKESGFNPNEKQATVAFINYSQRLFDDGQYELSTRAAQQLLKYCTNKDQLHYRAAGIALLTQIKGASFNTVLLKELSNDDHNYRGAVLQAASQIIDDVKLSTWISTLNKSSAPAKAQIIGMIGRVNHTEVLNDVLIPALSSKDELVRLAAIEALVYQDKSVFYE